MGEKKLRLNFEARLEFYRQEDKKAFLLLGWQAIGEEGNGMMKDAHFSLLDG